MNERDKYARTSHLALYRKYRSRNLDEIIGQPQVTDILKSVATTKKFAHAYLFTGQRGTGKTSVARILAHLINGTDYGAPDIDIIEIDAASNNGVDDVRELRDNVNLAPMQSEHKIYIIDEVHMLSGAAFNALLKTIEEPPAHVVFILATTEIQKMPATILSRVQRFHFRPVPAKIVAGHLRMISDQENINVDNDALNLIAERGGGSFRDSITLLDQLSGSGNKIGRAKVEEILGLAPETAINEIVAAVENHDVGIVVSALANMRAEGVSAAIITDQMIARLSAVATTKPRFYDLIEKLLEVPKSAAPDIKLIAVLSGFAAKGTMGAATMFVKNDEKSTLIIEQNTKEEIGQKPERKDRGKADSSHEISDTSIELSLDSEISSEPEPAEAAIYSEIAEESDDIEPGKPEKILNQVPSNKTNVPTEIIWADILTEAKNADAPSVLAVLKSANFDYKNGELTLYFDKSFHRKNAIKANFRGVLGQIFQNLYQFTPQIIIAESAKPATESKNSDIAQIAAIMGGGEIVRSE